MTVRAPSTVTTVPPVTMSETTFGAWASANTPAARTSVARDRNQPGRIVEL